jgi:lipopolysaccharide export system protein LptA
MNIKNIAKIFLVLAIVGTLIYVMTNLSRKSGTDYTVEDLADGEGMVFKAFNKENRQVLELNCTEAHQGEKDRMNMKNIVGVIFKKGKMNKDLRIFGDNGFVENNYHNFFVENNARLESDDFTIKSPSFTLKDRAEMHSSALVSYKTKGLSGKAVKGMSFYLKVNTLKFFDTNGIFKRDNRLFNYQSKILWFIEEERILVLEKDAVIRDDKSVLRSEWITMQFNEDLEELTETTSQKNSYLFIEDPEKQETKEIKSENIRSKYDEEGKMTQLTIINNAEILLKNPDNRTRISSNTVDMYFDGPTGKAQKAVIPSRGLVVNRGKNRFRVTSDNINITYDEEGQLNFCQGRGNSRFMVDKYKGTTDVISYDIKKEFIRLDGADSKLINEQNTFYSSNFMVNTKDRTLTSGQGVKSVIILANTGMLFSDASIFINAQKVALLEKENKFVYDKNVKLNQGDVTLEAGNLDISHENRIIAKERVALSFKNSGKELTLKGNRFELDSQTKRIQLEERSAIKSDENVLMAASIVITFNDDNEIEKTTGKEKVNFLKDDLSGFSDRVEWDFKKDIMVLRGSPRIQKEGGGKTTGKVLKIDLKSGKITILSASSDRTETIIQ